MSNLTKLHSASFLLCAALLGGFVACGVAPAEVSQDHEQPLSCSGCGGAAAGLQPETRPPVEPPGSGYTLFVRTGA
jgi:hypothetical protein